MPSKTRNDRPAAELRSGRTVEKILKLRTTPLPGTQVAVKMGYAKSRLTTMLARIRWMAKVELGGGCRRRHQSWPWMPHFSFNDLK